MVIHSVLKKKIARNHVSKISFILQLLLLLSHNLIAQLTADNPSNKTIALFQAIRSASTSALQKQLADGSSANDSLNSYSALMAATLNGTLKQMKILIEHGADVNYHSKDGTTALWLAVPDWDKTKLLLENGADPNYKIYGYGVLVKLAAMPGTINIFHLLIDKGADLKKSTSDNYLVYNAASSGDTAILGYLLRNGFKANDTVSFGDYPIDAALGFRSFATLKMLVDNGANVNIAPVFPFGLDAVQGFTPLMSAALAHDKKSFMYLLDHGANPNAKCKHGYTALILLQQSETDDPEMTMTLIKHGADVTVKAPDGTDALYYAKQKGNVPSVTILEKYSAK
jgi:ankyrin repeat protein